EQLEMDPTNAVWDAGHKELVPGSGRIVAEPPVPLQRLLVLSLRGFSVANMKGGSAEIESRVGALRQLRSFLEVHKATVEIRGPFEHCSEIAQSMGQQLWLPH